jgi:hypothetical protein
MGALRYKKEPDGEFLTMNRIAIASLFKCPEIAAHSRT